MRKTGIFQTFLIFIIFMLLIGSGFPSSHWSSVIAANEWNGFAFDANWTKYHSYEDITNFLSTLNYTFPHLVDVFEIGKSWRNKPIYCVRLANEDLHYTKPKILFVGYHHAREPITAELLLYFVKWALENYGQNATVKRMIDLAETYVIVALNVDGFDLVKINDWQRKNARPIDEDGDGLVDEDPPEDMNGDGLVSALFGASGEFVGWEGFDNDGDNLSNEDWIGGVDLNRNYGYAWNATTVSGSVSMQAEDFKGPFPFSEPETRALRDLALSHSFKYALSFHSGAEVVYYPWFYTKAPTNQDGLFREVAVKLSTLIGVPYVQGGRGSYTSSGIWDDWMYGNRSTIALTCEIYRNDNAWMIKPGPQPRTYWQSGILEAFNPPPYRIPEALSRWLPALTYLVGRAINEMQNRDVEVTQAFMQTGVAYKGWSITVNASVRNNGEQPEDVDVQIYFDEKLIATEKIERLASKEERTSTFCLSTSDLTPCKNYSVLVEVKPLLGEDRTENNRLVAGLVNVRMMGDVNGDNSVNIIDLALIAKALGFGEQEIFLYDLNRDGKMNIIDLALAAVNFGK